MPPKKRFNVLPNPDLDLADRHFDGLDITLWWVKGTMHTYVTVNDSKTQQYFRVETPEHTSAMEVYQHPFAFKADEIVEVA